MLPGWSPGLAAEFGKQGYARLPGCAAGAGVKASVGGDEHRLARLGEC